MDFIYELTDGIIYVEENQFTTYGISCSKQGSRIFVAEDVSSDRELVEELVKKLNSNNVSPVHFLDIIEDEIE